MEILTVVLVVLVAFLAGVESILDQFQFHQPIVCCTLMGLVSGNLEAGIILGGTLQMLALGWANIGAAVAPDAALASVGSSIAMILLLEGGETNIANAVTVSIAIATPVSVAGTALSMAGRTLAIPLVHGMDNAAKTANYKGIEFYHWLAVFMQGIKVAIPAAALCFLPPETVAGAMQSLPAWLVDGMAIGGGMVAAVGYAMVINLMASKDVWPFFALGFIVAIIGEITLIGLGVIGVALALIYLALKESGGSAGSAGDPIGDIIDEY